MPPGHVLALLLLGLECLELDVEIGPALDPCWSPTPTLPWLCPCSGASAWNSLSYRPRDHAVQNLGRPESDSWRWLLKGPGAGSVHRDRRLPAPSLAGLSPLSGLRQQRLPHQESQPHLKAGRKGLARCRCHT